MKIQDENHFENDVRILHKKFKVLDKPTTKILFQFCQFDVLRTYKVLAFAKTLRNPNSIIEMLMRYPEKSQDYIDGLVKRYDKEIGHQIDLFIQKQEVKIGKKQIIKLSFEFFKQVPQDTIGRIMTFLDPYSFKLFSFTCSQINSIGKSQSLSTMYKSLSLALFSTQQPRLPFICRFQVIKKFVQTHPQQYFPYYQNFKNAVSTSNLRNYIWKCSQQDYKVSSSYYTQFGSYQNMFEKCPRIHFNGYYLCKHKYVKMGEKDMYHSITPVHIIYYYRYQIYFITQVFQVLQHRYFRFLQDGSIIYYISNKKVKDEDIMKHLSKNLLQQQPIQSIIGQYMQFKNFVYLKTVKQNSVFSYDLQIRSSQNKICNQLSVIHYGMQLIDKSYMHQTLYESNPNKQEVIFNYCFCPQIQQQNSLKVQSCSL